VTTLDLLRILLFDAVILALGNGLVQLTSKFFDSGDRFFQVASTMSHGLFLLLYFIVVLFHVVEFLREQRRGNNAGR
jgi:hypothetical protein